LPPELIRLQQILLVALTATAPLWPPLRMGFGWLWQVAHQLGSDGPGVAHLIRRSVGGLLGAMMCHRHRLGALAWVVEHFVRVSRSYWSGLFHCYAVDGLPRTNNDLEHFFGSYRYHERRASGRKSASPTLVLRGEVRMLAAAATRQHHYVADELAGTDFIRRTELRQRLECRRRRRVNRRSFRRDSQAFLHQLEQKLLQPALPS
jgi:hypothetical protein